MGSKNRKIEYFERQSPKIYEKVHIFGTSGEKVFWRLKFWQNNIKFDEICSLKDLERRLMSRIYSKTTQWSIYGLNAVIFKDGILAYILKFQIENFSNLLSAPTIP